MQKALAVPYRGATIRGTVYLPEGGARHPTVLMLHSFTGNRIETGFLFVEIGRDLARRGIAAVTFDFRNSGESDGLFERTLPSEQLADALHMAAWLRAQPFVDRRRLAVLGYSLGGLIAACVCGRLDVFQTMVLFAPTTVDNLCRFAGESPGPQQVIIGPHALHPDFFSDLRTLDPLSDCRRSRASALLVQGTHDKAVPPHVSDAYREAVADAGQAPAQVVLIEEADHRFNGPAQRARAVAETGAWLERALDLGRGKIRKPPERAADSGHQGIA